MSRIAVSDTRLSCDSCKALCEVGVRLCLFVMVKTFSQMCCLDDFVELIIIFFVSSSHVSWGSCGSDEVVEPSAGLAADNSATCCPQQGFVEPIYERSRFQLRKAGEEKHVEISSTVHIFVFHSHSSLSSYHRSSYGRAAQLLNKPGSDAGSSKYVEGCIF